MLLSLNVFFTRQEVKIGRMSIKFLHSVTALTRPSAIASLNNLTFHANTPILLGLFNNLLVASPMLLPLVTATLTHISTPWIPRLAQSTLAPLMFAPPALHPHFALVQSLHSVVNSIVLKVVAFDVVLSIIGLGYVHCYLTHQARARSSRLRMMTLMEVRTRLILLIVVFSLAWIGRRGLVEISCLFHNFIICISFYLYIILHA